VLKFDCYHGEISERFEHHIQCQVMQIYRDLRNSDIILIKLACQTVKNKVSFKSSRGALPDKSEPVLYLMFTTSSKSTRLHFRTVNQVINYRIQCKINQLHHQFIQRIVKITTINSHLH